MMIDYELKIEAQNRIADHYDLSDLIEALGDRVDIWDLMEELWDKVLETPSILERIGMKELEQNDLS
jgi:hypothetical protein